MVEVEMVCKARMARAYIRASFFPYYNAILQDEQLARVMAVLMLSRGHHPGLSEEVRRAIYFERLGSQILSSPTVEGAVAAMIEASRVEAVDCIYRTNYFLSGARVQEHFERFPMARKKLPDGLFSAQSIFPSEENRNLWGLTPLKFGKLSHEEATLLVTMLRTSAFCLHFLAPRKVPLPLSYLQALVETTQRARAILLNSNLTIFYGYNFSYADLRTNFMNLDPSIEEFLYYNLFQDFPSRWDVNGRHSIFNAINFLERAPESEGYKTYTFSELLPDTIEHFEGYIDEKERRVLKLKPSVVYMLGGREVFHIDMYMYDGRETLKEARKTEPQFKQTIWEIYEKYGNRNFSAEQLMRKIKRRERKRRHLKDEEKMDETVNRKKKKKRAIEQPDSTCVETV